MNAEQLIAGIKKLSPAPGVLPELRKLLKDGDSAMHDIVNLIKVDGALSSQLVRVSNSPFYGSATPSSNIEEAINRIGFHEVYKLVAFLVCNSVLNGKNAVYNLPPDKLWKESISCGLIMQALASKLKTDPNNAYTIGLMHSIGKTAINAYYQESKKAPPAFGNNNVPVDLEYKILGFSHAEAGALLLDKWKYSKETTDPIAHQFDPSKAGEYEKSAYSLFISKQIMPHLDKEPEASLKQAGVNAEILDKLGLCENEIIDIIISAKENLSGMDSVFKAS